MLRKMLFYYSWIWRLSQGYIYKINTQTQVYSEL